MKKRNWSYLGTKKKKKQSGTTKFFIALSFIVIILFSFYVSATAVAAPVVQKASEAKTRALITSAINSAIFIVMVNGVKYSDLIEITKNIESEIIQITANTILVNKIANDTARASEQIIGGYGKQKIDIPLGTLTKIPLLTGYGPDVSIYIEPICSVKCVFNSEFQGTGINQTHHKIYLEVNTEVTIITTSKTTDLTTSTQILIAESLIVGKIPEVFLSSNLF